MIDLITISICKFLYFPPFTDRKAIEPLELTHSWTMSYNGGIVVVYITYPLTKTNYMLKPKQEFL